VKIIPKLGANVMTTLPYAQDTSTKAKRVTIDSVRKVTGADFTVVCLLALTGLVVTALVAACVGSLDFVDFLAPAG